MCCMFTDPRISLQSVAAACAYMILLFMLALAPWLDQNFVSTIVFCMRHKNQLPCLMSA